MADWQPRDAVQRMAEDNGWSVRRIKIDDGCYEIDGRDAEGRRIEVTVLPPPCNHRDRIQERTTIVPNRIGAETAKEAAMTKSGHACRTANGHRRSARCRVWDPLVRVFHCALVVAFAAAWLTADELQPVHEIAGYTVAGLVAFRLVWGLVGSRYARFTQFLKGPATRLPISSTWRAARSGATSVTTRPAPP